jgi:hypothetical protein
MLQRLLIAVFVLGCVSTEASAEDPDAEQIAGAVNEGVAVDIGSCYSVSDVKVLRGGETSRGDRLYLCDARLEWRIGRADLIAFWEEPSRLESPEFAELVEAIGEQRLRSLMIAPAGFEPGDEAARIRFRVRLERAGDDWIVTEFASSKRPRTTEN